MNPLLPLNEYVPDAEPRVFDDRVFLYGSHDKAGSDRFCVQDYVVYSAPVSDLRKFRYEGISYRKDQDPRSEKGKLVDYYAPDCIKGNDGRYYLYYFASGPNVAPFGPISVAVSFSPAGPFEYLHDICYKDGRPVLAYLTNDPTAINDDGHIRLYYGWGLGRDFSSKFFGPLYRFVLSRLCHRDLKTIKSTKPSILSCAYCELEEDMYTVKGDVKAVLDSKSTAQKGTPLFDHPFYEAPSIRKIGRWYYLVYSSNENNELAYAKSLYPDHGFEFGGVIISNSDLGYKGNRKPKFPAGTIHGGIADLGGRYAIFYHRCTNDTDFSRQAMAEWIKIDENGHIEQVGITTSGLTGPIKADGEFAFARCCYLYNKRKKDKRGQRAIVTELNGKLVVTRVGKGTVIGFKYFDLAGITSVSIQGSKTGEGEFLLSYDEDGLIVGRGHYADGLATITLERKVGISAIFLTFEGSGPLTLESLHFNKGV